MKRVDSAKYLPGHILVDNASDDPLSDDAREGSPAAEPERQVRRVTRTAVDLAVLEEALGHEPLRLGKDFRVM